MYFNLNKNKLRYCAYAAIATLQLTLLPLCLFADIFTSPIVAPFSNETGASFHVGGPDTIDSYTQAPADRRLYGFRFKLDRTRFYNQPLVFIHEQTGRQVPFQLDHRPTETTRTIYFFAVAEEIRQTFTLLTPLQMKQFKKQPTHPQHHFQTFDGIEYRQQMQLAQEDRKFCIDNGKFLIRTPADIRRDTSRDHFQPEPPYAVGPIDAIGNNGDWWCRSHFHVPDYRSTGTRMTLGSKIGKLFVSYTTLYSRSLADQMRVTVHHILGYDFVIIEEHWDRVDSPRNQHWSLTWHNFIPTEMHTPFGTTQLPQPNQGGTRTAPLATISPPNSPPNVSSNSPLDNAVDNAVDKGVANALFVADDSDYAIGIFPLESFRWETESPRALAEIAISAKLTRHTPPPLRRLGFLQRNTVPEEQTRAQRSAFPAGAGETSGKRILRFDFPIPRCRRVTGIAVIPKAKLMDVSSEEISRDSLFDGLFSGKPEKSSPADRYLQRLRLNHSLLNPAAHHDWNITKKSSSTETPSSLPASISETQTARIRRWSGLDLKFETDDDLTELRKRTYFLTADTLLPIRTSYLPMRNINDIQRRGFVWSALLEHDIDRRDYLLQMYEYSNKYWLHGNLNFANSYRAVPAWVGGIDNQQWQAFQKLLEWSTEVEQFHPRDTITGDGLESFGKWLINSSIVRPNKNSSASEVMPTFIPAQQLQDLDAVLPQIEQRLERFAGDVAGQLRWLHTPRGMPPELSSCKLPGFGFCLRAGVGTDRETAVHLYQRTKFAEAIAGVPNGAISVVSASGRLTSRVSTPQGESIVPHALVRDHSGSAFVSIGCNDIDRPVYDLGMIQYGEITSATDSTAWPSYNSRSCLLMSSDYLVIFDDVAHGSYRFDWVSPRDEELHLLSAQQQDYQVSSLDIDQHHVQRRLADSANEVFGMHLLGIHEAPRSELLVDEQTKPIGMKIITEHKTDYIFQDSGAPRSPAELRLFRNKFRLEHPQPVAIHFQQRETGFTGHVGAIRLTDLGASEMAIIRGSSIRAWGVELELENPDFGISISSSNSSRSRPNRPGSRNIRIQGRSQGQASSNVRLTFHQSSGVNDETLQQVKVYLDGKEVNSVVNTRTLEFKLPAAIHRFEITNDSPTPGVPEIRQAENTVGGARITWTPAANAAQYEIQMSSDWGKSYNTVATSTETEFRSEKLKQGQHIHLRVIAVNGEQRSQPSPAAFVEIKNAPPLQPRAVELTETANSTLQVTWGSISGAREYKLYVRPRGEHEWEPIYYGPNHQYTIETNPKLVPEFIPTRVVPAEQEDRLVFEYAVSAVNDNGESPLSHAIDTRGYTWRHWHARRSRQLRAGYQRGNHKYSDFLITDPTLGPQFP